MQVEGQTVWVFGGSRRLEGGNSTAVVRQTEPVSDEVKANAAKVFGYPESAFVDERQSPPRVQFFTSGGEETDFCGHATLGTAAVLLSHGELQGRGRI